MTSLHEIENELRQQPPGWWQTLCDNIPELLDLADTPQPPEHHAEGDVAVHTRLAVEVCPEDCDPDLLWVALLHDIGKPATTKQNENGRITAHGHAKAGAEMAGRILTTLGMSEKRRERILWAIRHHTFHHSWQLQKAEDLSKKQRSYLIDPNFPLLLEFLRIDTLASQGRQHRTDDYAFYKDLWEMIMQDGRQGTGDRR